jgi:hypothetical protein
MEFVINYNYGNGQMTLYLENFFARRSKGDSKEGRFEHTTKPDIYKVLTLAERWCEDEQLASLMDWLNSHNCTDIVRWFYSKYPWRQAA